MKESPTQFASVVFPNIVPGIHSELNSLNRCVTVRWAFPTALTMAPPTVQIATIATLTHCLALLSFSHLSQNLLPNNLHYWIWASSYSWQPNWCFQFTFLFFSPSSHWNVLFSKVQSLSYHCTASSSTSIPTHKHPQLNTIIVISLCGCRYNRFRR